MDARDFEEFVFDAKLSKLIELNRVSDDLLDVISLNETQHSDVLAWCLTPGEGHLQHDAVIKDLLLAAARNRENVKFDSKAFFQSWTPGRIMNTSFGSAFVAREFSLPEQAGRLDLFLIDPQNKIVVVIENKAGAKLGAPQLENYHAAVKEIARRPVFKDYDLAFLVVDRDLDSYDDKKIDDLGNKWILLDYLWLRASAERAKLQVERNNQGAQLLMSYCHRQTGWESQIEVEMGELCADLVQHHEKVINALREIRHKRINEWTPSLLQGEHGELLAFFRQHSQVCQRLMQANGISAIKVGIKKALPEITKDQLEYGRIKLRFIPSEVEKLMHQHEEAYWPIFICIRRQTKREEDIPKFKIRFAWRNNAFNIDAVALAKLRECFAEENEFKDLKNYQGSNMRWIAIRSNLTASDAISNAVTLAGRINALLMKARSNLGTLAS